MRPQKPASVSRQREERTWLDQWMSVHAPAAVAAAALRHPPTDRWSPPKISMTAAQVQHSLVHLPQPVMTSSKVRLSARTHVTDLACTCPCIIERARSLCAILLVQIQGQAFECGSLTGGTAGGRLG